MTVLVSFKTLRSIRLCKPWTNLVEFGFILWISPCRNVWKVAGSFWFLGSSGTTHKGVHGMADTQVSVDQAPNFDRKQTVNMDTNQISAVVVSPLSVQSSSFNDHILLLSYTSPPPHLLLSFPLQSSLCTSTYLCCVCVCVYVCVRNIIWCLCIILLGLHVCRFDWFCKVWCAHPSWWHTRLWKLPLLLLLSLLC